MDNVLMFVLVCSGLAPALGPGAWRLYSVLFTAFLTLLQVINGWNCLFTCYAAHLGGGAKEAIKEMQAPFSLPSLAGRLITCVP